MQIAGVKISKKLLASLGGALVLPFLGMPEVWVWPSAVMAVAGVIGVAVVDMALALKGAKTA